MSTVEKIVEQAYVATTQDHLAQLMGALADRLQAAHYCASRYGSADRGTTSQDFLCSLTPRQLVDHSEIDKRHPPSLDPVMQHLRTSSRPIFWDATSYHGSGQDAVYPLLNDVGFFAGVSVALHLSPAEHFIVGVAWDRPVPLDPRILSDLQMLAIYIWPAFRRTWEAMEFEQLAPAAPLTQRECECLYWVGRGMNDGLISQLLGISKRTVERTIQTAYRKLNAANRIEGAVTAARLGLTESFRLLHRGSRVASLARPVSVRLPTR